MKIEIVVPGKPQGKQRPRHTKSGHTYTPRETVEYEQQIRALVLEKYPGIVPTEEPVQICISAYFGMPKSKKRSIPDGHPATCKPDTDNIAKIIMDALNGIVYKDDKQVFSIEMAKFYTTSQEKAIIRIYKYGEDVPF